MNVLAHAHTTYSHDGRLTVRELADLAAARGFQAVLVADHYEDLDATTYRALIGECRAVQHCLMVPGCERDWDGHHVLAIGLKRWLDAPDAQGWAHAARALGSLVVSAHPRKPGQGVPPHVLAACDAVEVWNSRPAYDGSLGPDPRAYDLLGESRLPICGQDVHVARHVSSVAIRLQEAYETPDGIMAALRRREYQMTNGRRDYAGSLSATRCRQLRLLHALRRPAVDVAIWFRGHIGGGGRSEPWTA